MTFDAAVASAETAAASQVQVGDADEDDGNGLIGVLGLFSMIGFTLLIMLTLNRKFPYHRWITTHRLMGVFFFLVSVHVWLALNSEVQLSVDSPPGIVILTMICAGNLAFLYKQFIHPRTRRHTFTLAKVNRFIRASELVLEADREMFAFRLGQFVFITVKDKGFAEAHPFTISSGVGEGRLRLTVKAVGDFTRRVRDSLTPGAAVEIEGPYGRFDPLSNRTRQVWIAGGIGITPFLSALRSMSPERGREVHLFYCVRARDEAVFLREILETVIDSTEFRVHLVVSNDGGRLTAENVIGSIDGEPDSWSYYSCGPKLMIKGISGGLAKRGVPRSRMHHEEFDLR